MKIKSLTLCHPKRRSFSPKKLTRGWIIFFRKNNFLDTIFVNHVMFNSMSYSLTNLDLKNPQIHYLKKIISILKFFN